MSIFHKIFRRKSSETLGLKLPETGEIPEINEFWILNENGKLLYVIQVPAKKTSVVIGNSTYTIEGYINNYIAYDQKTGKRVYLFYENNSTPILLDEKNVKKVEVPSDRLTSIVYSILRTIEESEINKFVRFMLFLVFIILIITGYTAYQTYQLSETVNNLPKTITQQYYQLISNQTTRPIVNSSTTSIATPIVENITNK